MEKLKFILLLLILNSLLLILSCSSPGTGSSDSYKPELTGINPILSQQRLTLRKEFKGLLTNRAGQNVAKHDLNIKLTRDSLRTLLFSCRVGKKRFHICANRPGFCRNTITCSKWKKRFLRKKKCVKYKKEYFSIMDDFEMLLAIKLVCMSHLAYPSFSRSI